MITKLKNFQLVRGDTMSFGFQVTGLSGTISAVRFTCKKTTTDTTNIFQRTLNNGITLDGDTYSVRIAPECTALLQAGRYYYDLEITVGSDVFTLLLGQLELLPDITRG